jgi:hypothetical protein
MVPHASTGTTTPRLPTLWRPGNESANLDDSARSIRPIGRSVGYCQRDDRRCGIRRDGGVDVNRLSFSEHVSSSRTDISFRTRQARQGRRFAWARVVVDRNVASNLAER